MFVLVSINQKLCHYVNCLGTIPKVTCGIKRKSILLYIRPPHPAKTIKQVWSLIPHIHMHYPHLCVSFIIFIHNFFFFFPITNHKPWHGYQWFITLATYWLHCDVTVMHVKKFVSPLSFSFVKNSTETTSVLRPQMNIFNITWFIDNSPLKRSRQWSKRVGHALYWFVFVILYF